MFFKDPNDLTNIDLASGSCYNTSIAQNLTFGYQGLPLGLGDTSAVNGSANKTGAASPLVSRDAAHLRGVCALAVALGCAFWMGL